MSDIPPQDPKPSDDGKQANGGGISPLRIILFVILIAMLGLLAYDFLYARKASQQAFASVEEWVKQDADKTPEEIHELLDRKPDNGLEDHETYFQETYSWRRGTLVSNYFVKVLYRKEGDQPMLHEVVLNVEPGENDLPAEPQPPVPEGDRVLAGGAAGEGSGQAIQGEHNHTDEGSGGSDDTDDGAAEENPTDETTTDSPGETDKPEDASKDDEALKESAESTIDG